MSNKTKPTTPPPPKTTEPKTSGPKPHPETFQTEREVKSSDFPKIEKPK
jgi:hypothetical protein